MGRYDCGLRRIAHSRYTFLNYFKSSIKKSCFSAIFGIIRLRRVLPSTSGTVEVYKKTLFSIFKIERLGLGGISNKFVKNALDYYNSDEEFDIIAAMEGLVAWPSVLSV